ncbi:MAG: PilZ domain-containing protein [Myxococcota bacterium]
MVELAERRRAHRLPVELHVEFRHLGRPKETFADLSRNLGAGGVFIDTTVGLELGTEVALEVSPSPGSRAIKVRARVVRVEEERVGTGSKVTLRTRGMALSFTEPDPGEMSRLMTLARRLSSEETNGTDAGQSGAA